MSSCHQCGKCCQLFIFRIGVELTEDLIDYYTTHGCELIDGNLHIPFRCPHLTEDNLCDIQETKPFICKDFDESTCHKYYVHEGCYVQDSKKEE